MEALINRVGSPMDVCVERLDENPEVIEERRKLLSNRQKTRSPFLVGSIEEVNRKISSLDRKLQGYTQLVCESRSSNQEELANLFPASSMGKDRYKERERETKDVNRFAGIYTLKSTFVPGLSERVKHISKISMQPSKTAVHKKENAGKPKFVELHQYPGYDPAELTPLPNEKDAVEILKKAAMASMDLDRKPHFKPEFDHLFYSQMSQAILQDVFWYYFLEKFQSSRNSQVKLFNRIAHNYVKLSVYAKNPFYRDTFQKAFPLLICQAVYSAFCHSFPDSYRQFDEVFKDDLVSLIMEWMTGIRLAPRSWQAWNMECLEPPNIKMRDDISSQKANKSNLTVNFDYLDNLVSSRYTSNTSLTHSGSRSSLSSSLNQKRHGPRALRHHGTIQAPSRKISAIKITSPVYSQDSHLIETVADAQGSPRKPASQKPEVQGSPRKPASQKPEVQGSPRKPASQKSLDPRKLVEALTPIREMTGEEDNTATTQMDNKVSQMSTSVAPRDTSRSRDDLVKVESHPACKGPTFVKSTFNVYGHSPLVAHFMQMKRMKVNAGVNLRVQRTEMENLPPLDAPTYKDIIRISMKKIRDIEKEFSQVYSQNMRENAMFVKKQKVLMREHERRESALLARTKEVKRLSDLIILEQKKDRDSISVGANAMIEAALMAE